MKMKVLDKRNRQVCDLRTKGEYIQILTKYGRWVSIRKYDFDSDLGTLISRITKSVGG